MLSFQRRTASLLLQHRWYISRAHPQSIPEFPIPDALSKILDDIQVRRDRNQKKDTRLMQIAQLKGKTSRIQRGYPDETIELVVNLNLDPRKQGQSLRGTVELPHGRGKTGETTVVVFTQDEELQEIAKQNGAKLVGADSLIDELVNGTLPVDSFQVALATPDIVPLLTKKGAARILGPRGRMPNTKVGTLFNTADELIKALENHLLSKSVSYRTEKEGIVHVPVGKGSFGSKKLLDNIGAVMKAISNAKPESYGKKKKKPSSSAKSQPKYMLKATLASTQSKGGVRVDLRTLDPTSAFFLTDLDPLKKNNNDASATNSTATSSSEEAAA